MNTDESYAVFAIVSTVVVSFIYYLIIHKMKMAKSESSTARFLSFFLWRKIIGFLVLGLIPGIVAWIFLNFHPSQAGLITGNSLRLWPWLAGGTGLFVMLNLFNSKDPGLQSLYPELRLREWDVLKLLFAAGGWILYLFGYEYLFRGMLFFSCFDAFGLWPAATINLALYSSLHLPKGMKEAIAAVPFGAFLIYLTVQSNSILPAVFIHSIQAISCEIACIYRNPEMRIHLIKTKKP